jgi:ComEC/Rec2-related protein
VVGIALGAACIAGTAVGVPGVLAVAVAGAALRMAGKISGVWLIVVVAAAGAGALRAAPAPVAVSPVWTDDVEAVRGVVVSGPMPTQRGQRFDVVVQEVRLGARWQRVAAIACVSAPDIPQLGRGDRVFLAVTAERVEDLPAGMTKGLAIRGCTVSLTAWTATKVSDGKGLLHSVDRFRRALADRLQATAPGDTGSLLAGLVTGDDGALSDQARNAFVATGTTHITAVSGSNIALVVVFAIAVGGRFGFHRRLFWQGVTAAGVWSYAVLVGLQPPALRAALVATGAVFAVRFGRRADLVTLTVLAAAVELLCRPSDYRTLSFRLSFVSALALALVLHGKSGSGVASLLKSGFIASAAAQIATTPVLISTFGQVSPLSLPTNLMIAPFVEVAFPVAVVASLVGLVSNSLGDAVAIPGAVSADVILRAVDAMAGISGAQVPVGTPGLFGNAIVAAGSVSAIALLSLECRGAIRRAWERARIADSSTLVLAGIGCLGFVIGLSLAAR